MDYEFNDQQNKSIANLVTCARAASVTLFALAAFKTAAIFGKGETSNIVYSIFTTVLAAWVWRLASAFDKIVKTQGEDTTHLVAGLQELTRTMRGIRIAQLLMIVFFIAIFGIAVIAFMGGAFSKHG